MAHFNKDIHNCQIWIIISRICELLDNNIIPSKYDIMKWWLFWHKNEKRYFSFLEIENQINFTYNKYYKDFMI